MKKLDLQLICLLLVLSLLTGSLAGCAAQDTDPSQAPTSASSQPTLAPTIPTEHVEPTFPTETTPTTEPPTQPPTEPPTEPTVPTLPELQPPAITAAQSFIYDTRLQRFVYTSADADTALYPASVTKLFTAYVALQFLEPTDLVTVGNELSRVSQDASVAGLERGSVWTVEGLLYASLLPSGCDASYVLAAAAGRALLQDPEAATSDALNAFMTQCNFLAWELGMVNTNFVTPDGYHHKDHYISITAYPIIAQCILSDKLLSTIVLSPRITVSYTSASGKKCVKHMNNTNRILRPDYPAFYRSEAVGLKTGSTTPAGFCLLSAFQVDGGYIIIGVFGCPEREARFTDTLTLFDYYMENTPD